MDEVSRRPACEGRDPIAKVERLTLWAKCFGFTSLALLVVAGGILAYRAVQTFTQTFTHPQTP